LLVVLNTNGALRYEELMNMTVEEFRSVITELNIIHGLREIEAVKQQAKQMAGVPIWH